MLLLLLSHFSRVQLFVTPWTVAHEAPLSVEFSRQEQWSRWLCPPPGAPPDPRIKPCFLCLLDWQVCSLPLSPPGKPRRSQVALLYAVHQSFSLSAVDVSSGIIICFGGLSCTLKDVEQHPWLLLTRCQQHASPHFGVTRNVISHC